MYADRVAASSKRDRDRIAEVLASYTGPAAVMSFDPDQVLALREALPALPRGIIAQRTYDDSYWAKLTPAQKERIVGALHRKGHVVGFLGDGINDSPALKASDVGISVDSAVDIAKESADIILLEKSLMVLQEGVIEGRKVFGNITKYIKMGASSNFGRRSISFAPARPDVRRPRARRARAAPCPA